MFFFSSKYKHGKNEVTVNVQVPKQNIFLTQNTCPWPCCWLGSLEFRQWLTPKGQEENRTVNNPLSHHSKKSLVNNQWRLWSNQQITNPKVFSCLLEHNFPPHKLWDYLLVESQKDYKILFIIITHRLLFFSFFLFSNSVQVTLRFSRNLGYCEKFLYKSK